ncbi:DUF3068 domain-containing protein [Jiangella alkaliphila]|uniref:DUF3068 domain-containing protein n=1 Tax=Jiangella alkaliphila TaxID=419479 RepID=A0A1H2L3Y0_9ACTN|nr:DUF3068 domain-containing protein [Jiangella alkaliphila]SDU75196.1 Protein of unknown function [Jiangella alkaliphila]
MRRSIGLVLVGLGVLMLVLAPLSRWYAYPRLAVVSNDVAERVSTGTDVTVLDLGAVVRQEGEVERVTDIRNVRRIIPDQGDSTGDTAVWDTSVTTFDELGAGATPEENVLSYYEERVAFDRHTAEAVDGYDQYYTPTGEPADRDDVEHEGYYFKLPFGTEQRSYPFWDSTIQDTRPMEFQSETTLEGLPVYVFEQVVEPTPVSALEIPGALFGAAGSIVADRIYSNTRTIWVEPHTGAIIKGQEVQDSYLDFEGTRGPTIVQGTLAYTDDQVAANVDEFASSADRLALVRDTVPIAAAAGGLLFVIVGLLLARRGNYPGKRRAPLPDDDGAGARPVEERAPVRPRTRSAASADAALAGQTRVQEPVGYQPPRVARYDEPRYESAPYQDAQHGGGRADSVRYGDGRAEEPSRYDDPPAEAATYAEEPRLHVETAPSATTGHFAAPDQSATGESAALREPAAESAQAAPSPWASQADLAARGGHVTRADRIAAADPSAWANQTDPTTSADHAVGADPAASADQAGQTPPAGPTPGERPLPRRRPQPGAVRPPVGRAQSQAPSAQSLLGESPAGESLTGPLAPEQPADPGPSPDDRLPAADPAGAHTDFDHSLDDRSPSAQPSGAYTDPGHSLDDPAPAPAAQPSGGHESAELDRARTDLARLDQARAELDRFAQEHPDLAGGAQPAAQPSAPDRAPAGQASTAPEPQPASPASRPESTPDADAASKAQAPAKGRRRARDDDGLFDEFDEDGQSAGSLHRY